MKRPGLYFKIFLSFIGVLVVAEMLIIGLFLVTIGRNSHDRFMKVVEGNIRMAGVYLEQSGAGSDSIEEISRKLDTLATIYDADFWLSALDGRVLAASPAISGRIEQLTGDHALLSGNEKMPILHCSFGRIRCFHMVLPVTWPDGRKSVLNAYFYDPPLVPTTLTVGLGLIVTIAVIALLVWPVARIITRPVKRLRRSALMIADGELSHRARPEGRDEIGELSLAFNHMAERLETMIRAGRRLLANVSHELRSPLARLRVAEEILDDLLARGDAALCGRYLESIRAEIDRMDQLLGRILELSRLEMKEASADVEPIRVEPVLDGIVERYQSVMEQKELEIIRRPGLNPVVRADREELNSVLTNLVDNAMKYTPNGGRIEIETVSRDGRIDVIVANTGQPLSDTDLTRIFEPFYRAAPKTGDGTGLGLAITRSIVEKHGGTILAENTADGVKLRVTWPAG